jgi:hypothetical protein
MAQGRNENRACDATRPGNTQKTASQLLTVEQLSQRWRCSKGLIYGLIASGSLKSTPLTHRALRVAESDAADFEQSRRDAN